MAMMGAAHMIANNSGGTTMLCECGLPATPEGSGMRASIGYVAYLLYPFIFMAVLIARAAKARPPGNQKDAVEAVRGGPLRRRRGSGYYMGGVRCWLRFWPTRTISCRRSRHRSSCWCCRYFTAGSWDRVQPGPPGWKDVVADWAHPLPRSAIRPLGLGAPDGTACSGCDLRDRFCRHHSPCRTPARVQRGATHLAPPWCLAMDRLGSPGDSRLVLLDPPMAPAGLRRARIPSVFDRVLFDPRSAPLWPGISGDIRRHACPVLLPSRLVYPDAPEIGHWGSRMT